MTAWKSFAAFPRKPRPAAVRSAASVNTKPGSSRRASAFIFFWTRAPSRSSTNLSVIAASILACRSSVPLATALLPVSAASMAVWFMFSRRTLLSSAVRSLKRTPRKSARLWTSPCAPELRSSASTIPAARVFRKASRRSRATPIFSSATRWPAESSHRSAPSWALARVAPSTRPPSPISSS